MTPIRELILIRDIPGHTAGELWQIFDNNTVAVDGNPQANDSLAVAVVAMFGDGITDTQFFKDADDPERERLKIQERRRTLKNEQAGLQFRVDMIDEELKDLDKAEAALDKGAGKPGKE